MSACGGCDRKDADVGAVGARSRGRSSSARRRESDRERRRRVAVVRLRSPEEVERWLATSG